MNEKRIIKTLILIILITIIILVGRIKLKPNQISYSLNSVNTLNPITNSTAISSTNNQENIDKNQNTILVFQNDYSIKNQKQQNVVSSNPFNQIKPQEPTPSKSSNDVYIEKHEMNNYYITGIVKNNTNNTIKNLRITADCYDKENNKLGYAVDSLNELQPNETWKFKMLKSSETTQYKNIKLTYN